MDSGLVIVYTTVAERADADRLATGAVTVRLAACAHISAIDSAYIWQGALTQSTEWRIDFKTTAARAEALQRWVASQHPYELPAIWTTPVLHASSAYAQWVSDAVAADLSA